MLGVGLLTAPTAEAVEQAAAISKLPTAPIPHRTAALTATAASSTTAGASATRFMKRIDRAARSVSHARSSKRTVGAYFRSKKSMHWYLELPRARGYLAQHQGIKKLTAYRTSLDSRLKRSGLRLLKFTTATYTERTKVYANSHYACTVSYQAPYDNNWEKPKPWVSFVCIETSKVRAGAQQLSPFLTSYDLAHGDHDNLAISLPRITAGPSAFAGYRGAIATAYGIYASNDEVEPGYRTVDSYFADAPGAAWEYLTDVDLRNADDPDQTLCGAWEASQTGSRAWAGLPCWRTDPLDPSADPAKDVVRAR